MPVQDTTIGLSQWCFQLLLAPFRWGYASGSLLKEDFRWLEYYLNEENSRASTEVTRRQHRCIYPFFLHTNVAPHWTIWFTCSWLPAWFSYSISVSEEPRYLVAYTGLRACWISQRYFLVIRMTSWLYWPPGSHINRWDSSSVLDLLGSHSYTEKPNCRDSWHLESRACS